ncbi:MAG: hypothetical protein HOC74_06295 [Gemmatimonadetes bacterium]|jgi:hypothetical protein|nr:hypothetical protein [Gemmatimonadota bacterium]
MSYRKIGSFGVCLLGLLVSLGLGGGEAGGELRWEDLRSTRLVQERDWLGLKLEVLGLRLSFPAYRIHLELGSDNAIAFTFLASSGLAEHLTEKVERPEAEKIANYHAAGIREQVENLLENEFPDLWASYDPQVDIRGDFLGPGAEWDDPPVTLGNWSGGKFSWVH